MTRAFPAWDEFTVELRELGDTMMALLPERLRNDPQVQQEIGRLMLGALAARTLDALASDGDHPAFIPWISATLNVIQPNADTVYKKAVITPGGTYRIRGDRGSLRILKMIQANLLPEETGKTTTGIGALAHNDFNTLRVDEQGHIDVVLSPTRPEGHDGDWWQLDPRAHALMLRQVAYNWGDERDPRLSIERLDVPAARSRVPAATLELKLRSLAGMTRNTAAILVEHVEEIRRDGTINKVAEMKFGGTVVPGGLVGQFYYEGAYDLEADEALIFEAKIPKQCGYWSVILTNDIYETIDWYSNQSSLNGAQAHVDSDGVFRAVISEQDPGVPNWLDNAGHLTGVVQGRWTDSDSKPIPQLRKVPIAEIRRHLPADTTSVTPAQRDQVLRERRLQLQLRPLW
jgi:Protein of unknown function (DUF1214)